MAPGASYDATTLAAVLAAARGDAGPAAKTTTTKKPAADKTVEKPDGSTSAELVTIEKAKTGRAKCRKCGTALGEGETRVGMYAWILGRNAITWQKPQCFVDNLIVAKEATGRIVCKKTNKKIEKGAVKVGLRSHSTTSWVLPTAAAGLLKPLAKVGVKMPALDGIDGADSLSSAELQVLGKSLMAAGFKAATGKGKGKPKPGKSPPVQKTISKPATAKAAVTAKKAAASAGSKVGGKVGSGTVQWRFGAGVAKGVLMPEQETDTMCYARTEKGNTKALGKGKDYWWKC
jgi:hypothetical protein